MIAVPPESLDALRLLDKIKEQRCLYVELWEQIEILEEDIYELKEIESDYSMR